MSLELHLNTANSRSSNTHSLSDKHKIIRLSLKFEGRVLRTFIISSLLRKWQEKTWFWISTNWTLLSSFQANNYTDLSALKLNFLSYRSLPTNLKLRLLGWSDESSGRENELSFNFGEVITLTQTKYKLQRNPTQPQGLETTSTKQPDTRKYKIKRRDKTT